jgi:thiaminase/transcriptional activator TenA
MSPPDFHEELRRGTDLLWRAVFAHPFVRGIGDGDLPRDRFAFYLRQDYVYLVDFAKVLSLACAKSRDLEDMGAFAGLLSATLNMEMDLHRRTCAAFGISVQDLERTRKGMITSAYTDLLVRTCYEGDLSDILAVLLPCEAGYAEIGQRLRSQGLPEDPFCRDWISTYSSREFVDLARWVSERMDAHARDASPQRRERWFRLYEASARFEYLFFDMSWKKEEWPAPISFEPER